MGARRSHRAGVRRNRRLGRHHRLLAIQSPGGVRYTRNGQFQLSATGEIVTNAGFPLLDDGDWADSADAEFIGNVEGRDLMTEECDVVVTDGFTGNVALKSLEGAAKAIIEALLGAFDSSDDARKGAELLLPALAPLYERANPDSVGGAALVGVNGVCMISHGSSSATAILNAAKAAHELAETDLVGKLSTALAHD